MILIARIVDLLITVINTLILIRVVLSWLAPMSRNGFTDLIYNTTEPILRPFRVLIPMGNMRMDISPIFLFYNFKKINFYAYILSREAMASLFL